jgi:hypothetical protein
LSRLHGTGRDGYGWLSPAGVGRFDSWSNWLRYVLRQDLRTLQSHRAIRSEVRTSYTHPQFIVDAGYYYSLYQAHNAVRNAAWSAVNAPEWVDDLVDFATAEASKASTAD